MSKRFPVMMTFAFLFAFGSLAVSAQEKSETAAKAGRLTIVEPVKDYGEVPKGDKLDWSFVIKNTGDGDLQILAAKPGCGCTVA